MSDNIVSLADERFERRPSPRGPGDDVARLFLEMIADAIACGATDVHIAGGERIRFRVTLGGRA